jgi:hypothetical protein
MDRFRIVGGSRLRVSRKGMSLVDTAMALAVTGVALAGMIALTGQSNSQIKDSSSAQMLTYIGSAASQYVQANNSALMTTLSSSGGVGVIPVGRTCATCAVPSGGMGSLGSFPSVQGGGFLPTAFIDANAYAQHHALLLKYIAPSAPQYPNGGIDAVVVSYGGSAIPDTDLGAIAGKVGAVGGFIPKKYTAKVPSGDFAGAYGSWARPLSDFGTGTAFPDAASDTLGADASHLAYSLAFASAAPNDFLYRDQVPGATVYNTMDTTLYMNGNSTRNNMVGAGSIDAQKLGNSDGTNTLTITSGTTDTYAISAAGNVGANSMTLASNGSLTWPTYGGGWYMSDTSFIRSFNNVAVSASEYADASNSTFQLTPHAQSQLYDLNATDSVTVGGSSQVVATATGNITAANGMTANTLWANAYAYSPVFCGSIGCGYNVTAAGTSHLNVVNADGTITAGNFITNGYLTVGNPASGTAAYNIANAKASGYIAAAGDVAAGNNLWAANDIYAGGLLATYGDVASQGGGVYGYSSVSTNGFMYSPQFFSAIAGAKNFSTLAANGMLITSGGIFINTATNVTPVQGASCPGNAGMIATYASYLWLCTGTWHSIVQN